MPVTVEVTQADIDAGERVTCTFCPVALAIKRAIPGSWNVQVAHRAFFTDREGRRCNRQLPEAARVFIYRFDTFQAVKPFSFALDYSTPREAL